MTERLIDIKEVQAMLSCWKTFVYTLIKDQGFPAPLKLGAKSTRWRESDVQNWINNLASTNKAA